MYKLVYIPWRIHGAATYGNMDPINVPQMLAYIPYMNPMGITHQTSSIYPDISTPNPIVSLVGQRGRLGAPHWISNWWNIPVISPLCWVKYLTNKPLNLLSIDRGVKCMPCFCAAYRLPYRISQAQVKSAFLCFLLPGMVRTPAHMLSTLPKHAAALTIKRWRLNDYKLWVMQSYATPNMIFNNP